MSVQSIFSCCMKVEEEELQLLEQLRVGGDFDQLMEYRTQLSSHKCLPESVWKTWIQDLVDMQSDLNLVLETYHRAFRDNLYVGLAREFLAIIKDHVVEETMDLSLAIEETRLLCRNFGYFYLQGHGFWVYLMELLVKQNKIKEAQNVLETALAIPLKGSDAIQKAAQALELSLETPKAVSGQEHSTAFKEEIASYENALMGMKRVLPGVGDEHLKKAWISYLTFLLREFTDSTEEIEVFARATFDRAVADLYLHLDVWLLYISFLNRKGIKSSATLDVSQKAARHFPDNHQIFLFRFRCLEIDGPSQAESEANSLLQSGKLDNHDAYFEITSHLLGFYRRFSVSYDVCSRVQSLYKEALTRLQQINSMSNAAYSCLMTAASVLAKTCSLVEDALGIWDFILTCFPFSLETWMVIHDLLLSFHAVRMQSSFQIHFLNMKEVASCSRCLYILHCSRTFLNWPKPCVRIGFCLNFFMELLMM